jgi:methylated-DNA-protein-cysteine methyltransferase-like protein
MTLKQKVLKLISKIPRGKVASYGFIATLARKVNGAREVGWILFSISPDSNIPWWRVINSKGLISIKNSMISKKFQKEMLEKENIYVDNKFMVDLKKYHWKYK